MFGVQFYPTPEPLADRMLRKVDWTRVKYALEPSAGKGDLVRAMLRNAKASNRVKHLMIDCCEIDNNLVSVLQGNGMTVVQDDFLHYEPMTRYDLIVMNPPFKNGDAHLLHALELLKNGGQCVCLLNAKMLEDMSSPIRQDIQHRFVEYGADIEIVHDAFRQAERKARVDVAMIYVDIQKQRDDRSILENLKTAENVFSTTKGLVHDVVSAEDGIKTAVDLFNFEAELGLKLIDRYEQTLPYFTEAEMGFGKENCYPLINLQISYGGGRRYLTEQEQSELQAGLSLQNQYMRELRGRYWRRLMDMSEISHLFTEEVRNSYRAKIWEFRNIDFTLANIRRLQMELSMTFSQSMESEIISMFENITFTHSMEKSSNVHYYNGWCTNSAYKIKPKIIIPCYGIYESKYGDWWEVWRAKDKLIQLEKILNYLDSGRNDGDSVAQEWDRYFNRKGYSGERLHFKFFDVELKKKGTIHIWFNDLELLKRWNVFAGMKKNYIPPEYGRKTYHEMSDREREVVNAFEGKAEYEKTMQNPRFYIGGATLMALTSGK